MNVLRPLLLGLTLAATAGAAPAVTESSVPDLTLEATSGRPYALRATVSNARFTVFVFFSANCPCVSAHDERLTQLARSYESSEVQFFFVDSEVGDAVARGKQEVQRRGYPFPILADPQGRLARAFGARFATTSIVVDSEGGVRYRGGIDSERRQPNPAGRFYLKEALSALLAGKAPDAVETKSLGCYLRIT
jgi:peroxiredoxin